MSAACCFGVVGFGKEKTSVGLFQQANGTDKVAAWDTLNSGDRVEKSIAIVLKQNDTVGLDLAHGRVTFSINSKEVSCVGRLSAVAE